MKQVDNSISTNRNQPTARFFLMRLFLMTLIAFSGAVFSVSAQDDASKVCRETQKIIEQYKREADEAIRNADYKNNEELSRDFLSEFNKAISNGALIDTSRLESVAYHLKIKLPKEVVQMTVQERADFQKEARAMLRRMISDLSGFTSEELDQQANLKEEQLRTRRERYDALNCDEVLKREKQNTDNPESKCSGFDGVWATSYGEMTITVTGNHVEGKYTFQNIKSTISGELTDNVLTGNYSQPGYPDKNYVSGKIVFKLTDTGWSGKWWAAGKTADNEAAGNWSGTCAGSK